MNPITPIRYHHVLLWGLILLTLSLHVFTSDFTLSNSLYEMGLTLRTDGWVKEGLPPFAFWLLKFGSLFISIDTPLMLLSTFFPIFLLLALLATSGERERFWSVSIFLTLVPLSDWALIDPNLNFATLAFFSFFHLYRSVRSGRWARAFIPSALFALLLLLAATSRLNVLLSILLVPLIDLVQLIIRNRPERYTVLIFLVSGFLLTIPAFSVWFAFSEGAETLSQQWSSLPYRFILDFKNLQSLAFIAPVMLLAVGGIIRYRQTAYLALSMLPLVATNLVLQIPAEETLLSLLPIFCSLAAHTFTILNDRYELLLLRTLSIALVFGLLALSATTPKFTDTLFERVKKACKVDLLDEIILDANIADANTLYLRSRWDLIERIRPVEVIPPGYPGQLLIVQSSTPVVSPGWEQAPFIRGDIYDVYRPLRSTVCTSGY